MALEDVVAGAALVGVLLYGVLGGADFGGGVWDLFAGGPRRREQREAIARAMGPVWEANHVWLIFVIVIVFTAFPAAFAALSVGLFGVFHFVLLGIMMRGAAFVFRSPQSRRAVASTGATPEPDGDVDYWSAVFGIASLMTPLLLGMAVGAITVGTLRVRDGEVSIEGATPWLAPLSLVMGIHAVAMCAYLAAVYLTMETEGELREDFRWRALLSGTVVVVLSVLTFPLLYLEAPHLEEGLVSRRSLPVLAVGAIAALLSGWALLRRRYALARGAAMVQVALLLAGWGLAQYPYLIYPDVTLSDAAAPEATLRFVLIALPAGLVLLVPSLWLLFHVFKGRRADA